ncbi:unnamed protein product, partial [Prorocentrum cordatum]
EVADAQEEGLSAPFLRHLCGTDELERVRTLEIQVDSAAQCLEPIGEHLPNLQQLKLVDSSVLCVRDLGIALARLEVLWMSRCGLQDLSGAASCLPALKELYIPFNDVADLSPLAGHEFLEVLDVEGNAVADVGEVSVLGMCPQLREVTLSGNPVSRSGGLSRGDVLQLLPQLAILDDAGAHESELEGARVASARLPNGEDESECDIGADRDFLRGLGDSTGRGGKLVEEPGDADLSDDDASDGSRPSGSGEGIGSAIPPLRPRHPLLIEGLTQVGLAGGRHAGEPDEDELVTERLKRARPRSLAQHAFTARPAAPSEGAWFSLSMPDRRQARTAAPLAPAGVPLSFRPATPSNSGFRLDEPTGSQDTASSLTCGDSLAGNPMRALRQRRLQDSGAMTSRDSDVDIRELLRRYQAYEQQRQASVSQGSSGAQSPQRRPTTPDVRIHTLAAEGARPRSGLRRPPTPPADSPGSAASRAESAGTPAEPPPAPRAGLPPRLPGRGRAPGAGRA